MPFSHLSLSAHTVITATVTVPRSLCPISTTQDNYYAIHLFLPFPVFLPSSPPLLPLPPSPSLASQAKYQHSLSRFSSWRLNFNNNMLVQRRLCECLHQWAVYILKFIIANIIECGIRTRMKAPVVGHGFFPCTRRAMMYGFLNWYADDFGDSQPGKSSEFESFNFVL